MNEPDDSVHRFKTNGVILTKPISVLNITLPEGMTEEEIIQFLKDFGATDEEIKEYQTKWNKEN